MICTLALIYLWLSENRSRRRLLRAEEAFPEHHMGIYRVGTREICEG